MTKAEREACKAEFITGNYRTLTEYADAHGYSRRYIREIGAAVISCVLYYVPIFKFISTGIAIIISTVAASVIGAIFFPVGAAEEEEVQ